MLQLQLTASFDTAFLDHSLINFSTESDMEDERESAADSGEEGDSEGEGEEEEEEEGSESEGEMSSDDNQMEKNTTNESGKG